MPTCHPSHRPHQSRPGTAPTPRRKFKLGMEMLEDRAVPATFNVNSLADILSPPTGTVTLRSAIQAANAAPGNNTINLTLPGTYQITLPGSGTDNTAGEFAITGTNNLTIENTSGGKAVVNGGGLNRVFDINPAASTTPFTVTFQGLTVTGGAASPDDGANGSGGGIRAQAGASVVLDNVVITDNTATADGGAISLESPNNNSTGTLTVNNSLITHNHGGDAGGGIETDGTGLVSVNPGTVVSYNTCINQGAGIWLDAGGASLNVTGAVISNNSAITMLAGGIGNAGAGNVSINASIVENNFSGGTGGGFGDAVNTGNLTVLNSLFLNNTAVGNGGAIQEGGPNTTITDSDFQSNVTQGNGGGLFVSGQNVTISGSRFAWNTATNGAGIEDTAGAFSISDSTLDRNRTLATNGGTGGTGGGLDVETGANTVSVSNDLFLSNFAPNGTIGSGGGINQAAGSLDVDDSQFTNNASNVGGAISFTGTTLAINSSTFNGNRSTNGGGAINFAGTGASVWTNDTFVLNVTAGSGGAILDTSAVGLTLLNDTITNNTAGQNGGGIAFTGTGVLSLENTIVAMNTAGGTGNDVFTAPGLNVTDQGGNFIGNLAGSSGFGSGVLTGNPLLGPLQDNGGPQVGAPASSQTVLTEAVLPGSPLFNRGVNSGAPTSDQRGFPRTSNPTIGAYEPQYASTDSANQVFVDNLFEVLLNRPADAGATGFVNYLNHGGSTVNTVLLLESSLEYRYDEVRSLYSQLFQRAATGTELQFLANYLSSGGTASALEQILIGGAEYYQLHGNTTDTFLAGLYNDGLDRVPDQGAEVYYGQELNNGMSRGQVAIQIFGSPEYLTDQVDALFQSDLGRPADPGSIANAVFALQRGLSEETLTAIALGSLESYRNRT